MNIKQRSSSKEREREFSLQMVGKISSERQHSGAATTGWHKKEQKDRARERERERAKEHQT
jgi:hypothetical protein